jgi:hypothetical protein
MGRTLTAALICALLASCATPVSYTNKPLAQYDKDTEYAVEERPDGFALTVYYSRYQLIPESGAIATACKSALTSIAWEIAEKRARKIAPINEQRIRISLGRNGLSGLTSCSATAAVDWS